MANDLIKRAYEDDEITEEQAKEIVRCASDPEYFMQKYIIVQHPTKGAVPFELYDYQKRNLNGLMTHNKNIILQPRQSGKCFCINSNITVRNKLTGEIKTITIGEFYEDEKSKDNTES